MARNKFRDLQVDQMNLPYYEEVKNESIKGKSLYEIFSTAWRLLDANPNLTLTLEKSNKSDEEADKLRNRGNAFYKKKQFEKALELYNLSIMAAQHPVLKDDQDYKCESKVNKNCFDLTSIPLSKYGGTAEEGASETLAKGFANRSALLFELGLHEKCIRDIYYAFEYGYPENLRAKLEDRKSKCEDALQKSKTGEDRTGKAEIQFTEYDPLTWRVKFSMAKNGKSDMPLVVSSLTDRVIFREKKPPKLINPNLKAPTLSNAIKIAKIPSKGRGMVAVRNIKPGEIIGVEKPFCIDLDLGKHSTNCSFCFSLCLTPLPCPSCNKVVYCNESCRAQSLSEEHWLECELLPTFMNLGADDIGITYKMLKNCTADQLLEMWQYLEEDTFPDKPENVFNSSSYRAVYNLCDNKDQYDFDHMLSMCKRAFAVTKVLEQSKRFFVNNKGENFKPPRERLCELGAVILAHFLRSAVNCYSSRDIKDEVGKGIYPVSSLLNHSCNASVYYYNRGRELILRAWSPIAAGEELTVAYTETYEFKPLAVRREYLRTNHLFSCSCEACTDKWPLDEKLTMTNDKCFVCKKTVSKTATLCLSCVKNDKVRSMCLVFEKLQEIKEKLDVLSPITREDFKYLCEACETYHETFGQPSSMISALKKLLHRCYKVGY